MEKKYRSIVITEKKISSLLEEMNERKINKEDIVYAGPSVSGYVCIYYR